MGNKSGPSISLDAFAKQSVLIPVIILTLCTFLLVQCSNPNTQAPTENSVHAAFWNDPTQNGSIQYHGTYVENNGTDSCKTCHGNSLQGTDDISGCNNVCHFGPVGETSPPDSGWIHGTTPHSEFLPQSEVCNECHAIMRQYNLGPPSCHDCHGQDINHPLGQPWLDVKSSQFHGQSSLNCASCHDLAIKCSQCHFGPTGSMAPIGSGWTHGNNSQHQNYLANQTVCNKCHNVDRTYGNPPAACHDCHED